MGSPKSNGSRDKGFLRRWRVVTVIRVVGTGVTWEEGCV